MIRRSATVVALVLLAGCGPSARELPLPGTSVSGDSYRITATFSDALNLPTGAPVKLNGVPVGKVRLVESHDFKARIGLQISTKARLHVGSTARLRSTTPLGELYVELHDSKAGAVLADGASLGTDLTSTAPSIEDSMAAASMLLNGGNLGQLGSIIRETNKALDGRESTARDLLSQLTTTTAAFEASSGDIDRALKAMGSVSVQLNKRESTINAALKDIAPAAKVLQDNTDELADLLKGVEGLGATSQRVIEKTHDELLQILKQAGPILDQLVSVKDEFGPGLADLVQFANLLDKGVPTDYLNTYIHFDDSIKLGLPGEIPLLGGLPSIETPGLDGTTSDTPDKPGAATTPDIGLGGLLSGLLGGNK